MNFHQQKLLQAKNCALHHRQYVAVWTSPFDVKNDRSNLSGSRPINVAFAVYFAVAKWILCSGHILPKLSHAFSVAYFEILHMQPLTWIRYLQVCFTLASDRPFHEVSKNNKFATVKITNAGLLLQPKSSKHLKGHELALDVAFGMWSFTRASNSSCFPVKQF